MPALLPPITTPSPDQVQNYLARWREGDTEKVDIALRTAFQGETFDIFQRGEHWWTSYAIWHRSVVEFRAHYGLDEFSIRDIDRYLWMPTKERRSMRAAVHTVRP